MLLSVIFVLLSAIALFWGSSYMSASFVQETTREILIARMLALLMFMAASYLLLLATSSA